MQSKPQIKIFHNGGWIDAVKDGVSPVLDEESIVTKVIKLIPENKPSLKIIQESIDIDLVVGKVEEKLNEKPFEISRVNGLGGRLDNITRDIARKTGYSGGGDTVAAGTGVTITTNSAGAKVINAISGSGTVTSIATAGLISGGTITTTGTITTSMATNKLVGRGTAGTGVMEEITLGTGLSFTGTTLNVTGGTGDVVGPASSTDNAIVRFDSTTGKLIQNSGVTISDTDVISTAGVLNTSMTASEIAGTDASKNIVSLPVATYPSLTELTYVKGVSSNIQTQLNAKGAGTVTSVGFTGGLISVATATTTPALTVAGTSGGIPYFSSASTWATSAALAANAIVIGGGAGAAPATTTTGTGVLTALGINVGSAGAFITFNGALGTPSSGTVTNLTGTASININGTVGATTPTTGSFTTVTTSGNIELGNASDTTLSRVSAGVMAVEGVTVPTISSTSTITNKRMQPRTASSTTASTLTPDLSSANVYYRTTQTATLTINAPTGTPVIGETIAIYVDSAGAQTLTMDSTYKAFGAAFPATTTAGKTLMITAQYNGTDWKTLWANAV